MTLESNIKTKKKLGYWRKRKEKAKRAKICKVKGMSCVVTKVLTPAERSLLLSRISPAILPTKSRKEIKIKRLRKEK